jgi:hypothetical protein
MGEQDHSQRAWLSRTLTAVGTFALAAYALIPHQTTSSSYFILGICGLITLVAIYVDRSSVRNSKPVKAVNSALDGAPPQQSKMDQQLEFDFPQASPASDDSHASRERPDIIVVSRGDIFLRKPIGIIGIALPFVLRIGILSHGGEAPASLSYYYYTPMRNVLVASLCILGLLLIVYKGYDVFDRYVSTAAGLGFFGIALFPVRAPSSHSPPWVYYVHTLSFILTIIALAVMSLLFTQAGSSNEQPGYVRRLLLALVFKYQPGHYYTTPQKEVRNRIYSTCAWLMLGSLTLAFLWSIQPISILHATQWLFWLEAIAMIAFGTSWLVKSQSFGLFRDRKAYS